MKNENRREAIRKYEKETSMCLIEKPVRKAKK